MVDDNHYPILIKWSWHLSGDGYASRGMRVAGKSLNVGMHQIVAIMKYSLIPEDYCPDHKDRNKLNNCSNNIRLATNSQNQANSKKRVIKDSTSQYKGVYFHKKDKSWKATIRINNKQTYLGSFSCEEFAAIRYNEALKNKHNSFALLNDVPKEYHSKYKTFINNRFTSKFRGVHFNKTTKKWIIQFRFNKKCVFIKQYNNEIEAAKAYNQISIKYLGKNARLNNV